MAASKKNYLVINKSGKWYNYPNQQVWSNVLKNKYIPEQVGYEKSCKADATTWAALAKDVEVNTYEIQLFNAICTRAGLRIARVMYNHKMLFPTKDTDIPTITSIAFITETGKYYKYSKESSASSISVKDALQKYINSQVKFDYAFGLDSTSWGHVNDQIDANTTVDPDILRIETFNMLCKNAGKRISAVVANPSTIFPK